MIASFCGNTSCPLVSSKNELVMVQKIAVNADQDSNYVFEAVYQAVDPVALPGVYCQTCKFFVLEYKTESIVLLISINKELRVATGINTSFARTTSCNQSILKASTADFPMRSSSGSCFHNLPHQYCRQYHAMQMFTNFVCQKCFGTVPSTYLTTKKVNLPKKMFTEFCVFCHFFT